MFLDWFGRRGLGQRLGFVTAVTAVLLAVGWVSAMAVSDGAVEAEWVVNAATPRGRLGPGFSGSLGLENGDGTAGVMCRSTEKGTEAEAVRRSVSARPGDD